MTLTEIRALPQELIETFEKWFLDNHGDPFNHENDSSWWSFEEFMLGAGGSAPDPHFSNDWYRGTCRGAGYNYFLRKGVK